MLSTPTGSPLKNEGRRMLDRVYRRPRGGGKIVSPRSRVPSGGRTFNAPSSTGSGKNRSGQSGGGKKGGVWNNYFLADDM